MRWKTDEEGKGALNMMQEKLLKTYLPVTLVIVFLDLILETERPMWLMKYLVVFSIFIWSFFLPKKTKDQERLGLSLFFVAAGDAFLYLPLALGYGQSSFIPYGMMMFILAYGFLILVYRQGLHLGRFETTAAMPSLVVFYLGLTVIWRSAGGPVISLTLVFWSVLCTMLWMALCTLSPRSPFREYGKVIALSGILMVVCDAGVGMGLHYPAQSALLYSLAKSIIWTAYIPAWMLVAWLAAEAHPLRTARSRKTLRSENMDLVSGKPGAEPVKDRKI
jgi:hypothetical protein